MHLIHVVRFDVVLVQSRMTLLLQTTGSNVTENGWRFLRLFWFGHAFVREHVCFPVFLVHFEWVVFIFAPRPCGMPTERRYRL